MIQVVQPPPGRDPGIAALVRRVAALEEQVRRLQTAPRTYASRGTVTAYTSPSVTAQVTDEGGNVRVLPFIPGIVPAVNDPVTIIDLPGYAFFIETTN